MTWIRTIPPAQADGELASIYRRISADGESVDQILQAHSLRPRTLDGHLSLYRAVLHHPRNRLSRAFAEAIGVLVSRINRCAYCIEHHEAGLRKACPDQAKAEKMLQALAERQPGIAFNQDEQVALTYVEQLTLDPASIKNEHIQAMQAAGWEDGEILEINQVAAYFAYANRTVQGLGVTTADERFDDR